MIEIGDFTAVRRVRDYALRPVNVHVQRTTPHRMEVTWNPPQFIPPDVAIVGYRVNYVAVDCPTALPQQLKKWQSKELNSSSCYKLQVRCLRAVGKLIHIERRHLSCF